MDFSLNEEQRMLQQSVAKFLGDRYGHESRRKRVHEGTDLDRDIWRQFAELGWLALPFAEEDGGLGGTLVESMILHEEFGKALVLEPWLATVTLSGGLLRHGNATQKKRWLEPLMEGRLQAAVALEEYGADLSRTSTSVKARQDGASYCLDGGRDLVLNAGNADILIIPARCDDTGELSLFVIETDRPGVTVQAHRLVNGQSAGRVVLDNATAEKESRLAEAATAPLAAVINEALLALGAQALGAMSALLEQTLEYTKNRKQFGTPLSGFQVLQHRMVDMFIACEQFRSLLLAATLKTQEGHDDAARAVHALKARIGQSGRHLAHEAIQLHGAMGMTDEMPAGHYLKHLVALDLLFGNSDQHMAELVADETITI